MFVIICNEGHMSFAEMKAECRGGNWSPVQTMSIDEVKIIPCFPNESIAARFIQRNCRAELKNKWLYGVVNITPSDVSNFQQAGYVVETYQFPKRFERATFSVVVFELEQEVDVTIRSV